MYLIDQSYFIGKISIANVGEYTGAETINIDSYIDKYARLFLQEVLGYALFKELDSHITDGALDPGAPQKWLDLVNGVEYTNNDTLYYWPGLIVPEATSFKESILADFTYLNYFENYIKSDGGLSIIETKNAMGINPTAHLVEVYNDFVNKYQGVCNNQPFIAEFGGVVFRDYFFNNSSGYVSLLQFLTDKAEDYPTAPKNRLNFQNSLGV